MKMMAPNVITCMIIGCVMSLFVTTTLVSATAIPTPRMAKTNCTHTCGNISIPFPFGIGSNSNSNDDECFLNTAFEVVCHNNNTVPKLKSFNLELISITLPGYLYDYNTSRNGSSSILNPNGEVTVKAPIIYSLNCNGKRPAAASATTTMSLEKTPFYFSKTSNVFASVGCNNLAIIAGTESLVGCNSNCATNHTINITNSYGECSGTECCQTSIPAGLQKYDIDFKLINEDGADGNCRYAFLAEQQWFGDNLGDLNALQDMDFVPLVLDWILEQQDLDAVGFSNLALSRCNNYLVPSRNTSQPTLFSCFCYQGFVGNALLGNCQDINECEDPSLNNCAWECSNTPGSFRCRARKRVALFIGMGIGIGVGTLLFVLLAWWVWKILKRRNEMKLRANFFKRNGGLLLEQQVTSSDANYVEKTKLFGSRELEKATDNFNKTRILGRGGQGTVYKGMLSDGRIVAIKKSIAMNKEKVEQFINEVVILSQINHRNVVKLLGCCLETEVPLLVYEYVPNGTLHDYLHDPNEEIPVSWEMCLKIATEVAGALSYLHSAASIPIYHRDIKSTNIMLDEKYRAKVADFGTSKSVSLDQTHVTTLVHGTFGYLDPEYFQSSQFTDKSDVYSFGVVLAELITRQKAVSTISPEEHRGLANYFVFTMEEGRLFDIVDAQILMHGNREAIVEVANLARRCLNLHGRGRPTMREVAVALENLKILYSATQLAGDEDHRHEYRRAATVTESEIPSWDDFPTTDTFSSADATETSSVDVFPLLGIGIR